MLILDASKFRSERPSEIRNCADAAPGTMEAIARMPVAENETEAKSGAMPNGTGVNTPLPAKLTEALNGTPVAGTKAPEAAKDAKALNGVDVTGAKTPEPAKLTDTGNCVATFVIGG